jgi:LysR substrate binding domain
LLTRGQSPGRDLAVRIGELPDSSLVAIRVGAIRGVVCGSPAYFFVRGTPQSPAELGAHDCTRGADVAGYLDLRDWEIRRVRRDPFAARRQHRRGRLDAAITGIGITGEHSVEWPGRFSTFCRMLFRLSHRADLVGAWSC